MLPIHRLILVGLNHRTAPLVLRERLGGCGRDAERLVRLARERFPDAEAFALATCNRAEIYAARPVHGHPRAEQVLGLLAEQAGLPAEALAPHVYQRAEAEAVEHLFAVAAGLDSRVAREEQILAQVRDAYERAAALGACGPSLHPLLQRAIAVGRSLRGDARRSLAAAMVEHVGVDGLRARRVVCLGSGGTARLALERLRQAGVGPIAIVARNAARAGRLATSFGARARPISELPAALLEADLLVAAAAATAPLVPARLVDEAVQRRAAPLLVLDLAVPRNVDPAAGALSNVRLFDVDAIAPSAGDATETARTLVRERAGDFLRERQRRALGPIIERLSRRLHGMAADELDRALRRAPALSGAHREALERALRRMVNKLLHPPLHTLAGRDDLHAAAARYLRTLDRLLRLGRDAGDGASDDLRAR